MWKLRILDGLHEGAEAVLGSGDHEIGETDGCDVLIADLHGRYRARLGVSRNLVGLTPLNDAIARIDDIRVPAEGGFVPVGVPLTLGDVRVMFERIATPEEEARRRKRSSRTQAHTRTDPENRPPRTTTHQVMPSQAKAPGGRSVLLKAVALALAVTALPAMEAPATIRSALASPEAVRGGDVATNAAIVAQQEWITRLREFIGDEAVHARWTGPQQIRLSGMTRNIETRSRVQRVTADYRGAVEIVDAVHYVASKRTEDTKIAMPIRIVSIVSAATPYFIGADGTHYFRGAKLPDGAEVVAIAAGRVEFERDGIPIVFDQSR